MQPITTFTPEARAYGRLGLRQYTLLFVVLGPRPGILRHGHDRPDAEGRGRIQGEVAL